MLIRRSHRRALVAGVAVAAAGALGITAAIQFASAQQDTLRDAAGDSDIGVAVDVDKLQNDEQYAELVATEFNSVTAENVMKMDTLQPSQGQFNFDQADYLVQFAEENDQSIHGHTLVWHSQAPDWIRQQSGDELRQSMNTHIETVMGRYAGQVETWDVANEVVGDDGQLRDDFWLQGLGEGYIAEAFQAARAADPDARLYLNDYSIDGINPKSDAYYEIASDLAEQGLIDGMGFQAHLVLGQVPADMQENLQRFVDLGLEVRITELDIRMQTPSDEAMFEQQAEDYREVVGICSEIADCSGVTVWGLRDSDSWVPDTFPGEGDPLLFNDDFSKKPAYDAVLEALGGNGGGPGDPCEPTEEPTDPGEPTEDPTDPGDPTEDPTDPGEPTEDPTDPGDPTDDPTDPGDPTEDPTDPCEPTDDPTDPGGPTEDPTDPGDPTDDPTDPGDPTDDPTDPGEPTEDPTDPGEPTEDPTDPSEPVPAG